MSILFHVNSNSRRCLEKQHEAQFQDFLDKIKNSIGVCEQKKIKAYRIPSSSPDRIFKSCLAIFLRGDKSDCFLEFHCDPMLKKIEWPGDEDFNLGHRIVVGLYDFVDLFYLYGHLCEALEMKNDARC